MFEYVLVFLFLLLFSLVFYLFYDHYFKPKQKTESELYIEALKDLLNNHQEKAFAKLRQVVAEDSSNIDAYLRLGQILRENNKPQQALQVHKDLTLRAKLSTDDKVEILKQLYFDYIPLDSSDMAQAALKEIISLYPKSRWGLIKLLEIQKKEQKWDEAYETAVNLLKLEQNKSKKPLASFKYHMGMELYKKREYHKARILLKEALGFDPSFTEAYLLIGDSYRDENRLEDAVNFWNKLISTIPEKGQLAIERLKKSLFELGRYGEIEKICNNILVYDTKNLTVRYCLAEFYDKKGDVEQAEVILDGIIDDYPEDTLSLIELIRIHIGRKESNKIEKLLKTVENKIRKQQKANPGKNVDTTLAGI